MEKIKRLDATQKALDLIDMLESKFGPLMFYQAGVVVKALNLSALRKVGFSREPMMFVLET